jgi:hypothetical protein
MACHTNTIEQCAVCTILMPSRLNPQCMLPCYSVFPNIVCCLKYAYRT